MNASYPSSRRSGPNDFRRNLRRPSSSDPDDPNRTLYTPTPPAFEKGLQGNNSHVCPVPVLHTDTHAGLSVGRVSVPKGPGPCPSAPGVCFDSRRKFFGSPRRRVRRPSAGEPKSGRPGTGVPVLPSVEPNQYPLWPRPCLLSTEVTELRGPFTPQCRSVPGPSTPVTNTETPLVRVTLCRHRRYLVRTSTQDSTVPSWALDELSEHR